MSGEEKVEEVTLIGESVTDAPNITIPTETSSSDPNFKVESYNENNESEIVQLNSSHKNPLYDGLSEFSSLLTNALASIDGNVDQLKGSQSDTLGMLREVRTRVDMQDVKLHGIASETEEQRSKLEFALRSINHLQKSLESQLTDATKQIHKELASQRSTTKMDINSLKGNMHRSMSEVMSMISDNSKLYAPAALPEYDPNSTTQESIQFLVDRLSKLEDAMGQQQTVNQHLTKSITDDDMIQKVYDSLFDQITALEKELEETRKKKTDDARKHENELKDLWESNERMQEQIAMMTEALCSKQKLKEFRVEVAREKEEHHHHHHYYHNESKGGNGDEEGKENNEGGIDSPRRLRSGRKQRSADLKKRKRSARRSIRASSATKEESKIVEESVDDGVEDNVLDRSLERKARKKSPARRSLKKRRSRGELQEIEVVDSEEESDFEDDEVEPIVRSKKLKQRNLNKNKSSSQIQNRSKGLAVSNRDDTGDTTRNDKNSPAEGIAPVSSSSSKGSVKAQYSINRGNKAAKMQKTFSSASIKVEDDVADNSAEVTCQGSAQVLDEEKDANMDSNNAVIATDSLAHDEDSQRDEDSEAGVEEDNDDNEDFEDSLADSLGASMESSYDEVEGASLDSEELRLLKQHSIQAISKVDQLRDSYDGKMQQLDQTLDALKQIALKVEDMKVNQETIEAKIANIAKNGGSYDESREQSMAERIEKLKAAWVKVHGEMLFGLERLADNDSESDATGEMSEAKQDQGKIFIQKSLDLVQLLDHKIADFNQRENVHKTLQILHPSLESIYKQALVLNDMDDRARDNDALDKTFDDLISTDLTPSLKRFMLEALEKSRPVLDESIPKVTMKHQLDKAEYVLEHKANANNVHNLESHLKSELNRKVDIDDFHSSVGRMATAAELQRLHTFMMEQLNKGASGMTNEKVVQVDPFKIEEANLFDNPDFRNTIERFDLLNKHMQELQKYCAQFVPRDEVHEAMKAVITEVKALKKSTVTHSIFREGLKMKADTVEVDRVVKTITDAIGDLNFANRSIDDPSMAAAVHAKCLVCDKPITSQRTRSAYKASRGSISVSASAPLFGYDKNSDESLRPSKTHKIPQQSLFNKVTSVDPAVNQSEKVKVATELAIVRSSIDPLPDINDSPNGSPRQGSAPVINSAKERIRSSAGGGIGPSYKRDTR